ncbi:sulfoxide reductase heme-binding subunit YedZ [Glaciecola sp. XM2]|nr:sulfoxide reductase heme-binding subunit YedZ [Glaciecola sp. XM2]
MLKKPIRVHRGWLLAFRLMIHSIATVLLGLAYYNAINGNVSGDPVQYLLDFTGIGALNLMILSLLTSPAANTLKFAQLMVVRKTLGVYAAIYALAHLYAFTAYELQYEWGLVLSEIVERPYITVGMVALIILFVMLLTSFSAARMKLGKYWQRIHNFVYVAVLLGCLHFLWSVTSNWTEPSVYMGITLILLYLRRKKIQKIFK